MIDPQAARAEERNSPVLRDSEGGESYAPAFLQTPTRRDDSDEAAAPKPRRRRRAAGAADTPGGAEEA